MNVGGPSSPKSIQRTSNHHRNKTPEQLKDAFKNNPISQQNKNNFINSDNGLSENGKSLLKEIKFNQTPPGSKSRRADAALKCADHPAMENLSKEQVTEVTPRFQTSDIS